MKVLQLPYTITTLMRNEAYAILQAAEQLRTVDGVFIIPPYYSLYEPGHAFSVVMVLIHRYNCIIP